jgi:hypothetical protein
MLASINSAPPRFIIFGAGASGGAAAFIGVLRSSDMTNVAHRDFTERKPLPTPNSDFYQLVEVLNADELALVKKVREASGNTMGLAPASPLDRMR